MNNNQSEKKRLYSEFSDKWEIQLHRNEILEHDLKVTEITNGIVLPLRKRDDIETLDGCHEGGVCTEDYSFVAGIQRNRKNTTTNYSVCRSYQPETITKRDEEVIFGGVLFRHFGHSLVDGLGRMWYYAENPDVTQKIVFVMMTSQAFTAEKIFELMGLKEGQYEIITEPTQFTKIIVPEEAMFERESAAHRRWLSSFERIKESIRKSYAPSPFKKIYLTRTQMKENDGINEEFLEDFYRERGYEVIAPEKLPLEEQINIIMNAQEIACTMGTLAHLVVFAQNKIKITIHLRIPNEVVPVQLLLNELRELDWYIIDGTKNFLPTSQSKGVNFYLPTKYMKEYLDDNGLEYDPMLFDSDTFLQNNLYDYLIKWTSNYSNPEIFRRISRRTIFNVVDGLNRYLLDGDLQSEAFIIPESNYIEKNQELRQIVKKQKEELERSKTEFPEFIIPEMIDINGVKIKAEGKISIPFGIDQNTILAAGISRDINQIEYMSTSDYSLNDDGSMSWSAEYDFSDINEEASDTEYYLIIQIKNGSKILNLRLAANAATEKSIARGFSEAIQQGDFYLVPNRGEDSSVVVSWLTAEEVFKKKIYNRITGCEWINDQLLLSGYTETFLNVIGNIELGISIRKYTDENNCNMLFPVTVTENDDIRRKYWSASIDCSQLLSLMFNEETRWDFYVSATYERNERFLRVGQDREECFAESFLKVCKQVGNFNAKGIETEYSNICLEYIPRDKICKRFWIENISWGEDALSMDGYFDVDLADTDAMTIQLALNHKKAAENEKVISPLEIYDHELNRYLWKTSASYETIMEQLMQDWPLKKSRKYALVADVLIGDVHYYLEIGEKRRPGTLKLFSQMPQLLKDAEMTAYRSAKEDNLGIEVIPDITVEETNSSQEPQDVQKTEETKSFSKSQNKKTLKQKLRKIIKGEHKN